MPGKLTFRVGAYWKCRTRRNTVVRRASVDIRPLVPPRASEDSNLCALCKRESSRFTSHHLIPRSRGGKFGPQAKLCPTCHRQVHAMFSESTLAKELNSIAALRANPEFSDYLRWARHQKGLTSFRVRRAKNRR